MKRTRYYYVRMPNLYITMMKEIGRTNVKVVRYDTEDVAAVWRR